ncbi:MAG: hypothetical protein Q9217_001112, partial [Psora testacea]
VPGAIGMYALAIGVGHIGSTLPAPAYALLSGLNAATVGIVALAAVRLAERAITDKLTRLLVYLGGVFGMLHTALWYYPVLMLGAGLTSFLWDMRYLHACFHPLSKFVTGLVKERCFWRKARRDDVEKADLAEHTNPCDSTRGLYRPLPRPPPCSRASGEVTPDNTNRISRRAEHAVPSTSIASTVKSISARQPPIKSNIPSISWRIGTVILVVFFISFILTITCKAIVSGHQRSFSLFSSLYLAGTIIFGGGPVVIPLLREYMVTPGWVLPRDFLLGLAIIQAFPGPNFNFVVYLGALAVAGTSIPSYLGALAAFVAMYAPGLFIVVGFMGLWCIICDKKWLQAILRGVNAAAVGLVFTAVYKLWQMGYLTAAVQGGSSLGMDPWLVAITGTAYVGGAWFGLSPPVAIILGGMLGLVKYAVVDM